MKLKKVDYEVLNAASDDWESMGKIFMSVRFEFASDKYDSTKSDAIYWIERNKDLTLCKIAASLHRMMESGFMIAKLEDGTPTTNPPINVATECWYKTTDAGFGELEGIELT